MSDSTADQFHFVRKFPDKCCAEVSRRAESQPCDKPAVGDLPLGRRCTICHAEPTVACRHPWETPEKLGRVIHLYRSYDEDGK